MTGQYCLLWYSSLTVRVKVVLGLVVRPNSQDSLHMFSCTWHMFAARETTL